MEDLLAEALNKIRGTPKVLADRDDRPLVLVGDLHGDPSALEALSPFLGEVKVIFLGDYADRGKEQRRTLRLLLEAFVNHPEDVVLLRGNHEPGPSSHPLHSGYPYPYDVVNHLTPSELALYEQIHVELPLVYYNPVHHVVAVHGFLSASLVRSLPRIDVEKNFVYILWSDSDPFATHLRGVDVPDPWDWRREKVEEALTGRDLFLFKGHSPEELRRTYSRIYVLFGHCFDTGGYYRHGVRYAVVSGDIKTFEAIPCGVHRFVLSSLEGYLKTILR